MNILSAENLSLETNNKVLFSEVTFGISEGDKIALVGLNGCGKTSLMNIVAGIRWGDTGEVNVNKLCTIHYVPQNYSFNDDDKIEDHLFKTDNAHVNLLKRYEKACKELEKNYSDEVQEAFNRVSNEMDQMDGWHYEGTLRSVLSAFGINDLSMKMGELSGGMIKKISLAQAVIASPDLLILDEPTNHLDIDSILWLQDYLQKKCKTLLMVTHDRYFLENVCSTIWEIDYGKLQQYKGNFSFYLERKAAFEQAEVRREEKVKRLLKKEVEWMNRTPCARGTKQKARLDRVYDMMEYQGLEKSVSLQMSIAGKRLGKKIVEVHNVSKSYDGKTIIQNFSHKFKKGERVGIVGPNGAGKTTLVNLITQKIEPDTGSVDLGINTEFGIFDQHSIELDPEQEVIKFITSIAEVIEINEKESITASQMLERFLFDKKSHYKKIGKLSGGERRRLHLLSVIMGNPNFLILDEPTNDLDIQTMAVLEEFLEDFPGTLLMISHDRYFLDKLAHWLIAIPPNEDIIKFPSAYSDYLLWKKEQLRLKGEAERQQKKSEQEKVKQEKKADKPIKRTWKEERELESLMIEIDELETEKGEIEEGFVTFAADSEKMVELTTRYKEIEELIENKTIRWEELEAIGE